MNIQNLKGNSAVQRLICLALALVTVASLCFLPGMAVDAHAAKTADVPDPAEYFGKLSKTKTYKSHTDYYFTSRTFSKFPESKIDDYVDDLEDCGLELTKKANISTNGSITGKRYELYLGKEHAMDIHWVKGDKEIRVQVFSCVSIGAKQTATAPAATTPVKTTGDKVIIPDPQEYFGTFDKVSKGGSRTIYHCNDFSSYPKSKMESYVKALKKAGLSGGDIVKQDNGDMLAMFDYNGKNCISIRWYKKDQYVWFNISEVLSFTDEDAGTTPTKPASTGPSVIQLIEDCFGAALTEFYDEENYKTVFYYKSPSSFPKAKFDSLKKYVESKGMKYYLHDFRNSKSLSVHHDVGGSLIGGNFDKKTGEFKIEVKWEYIKKSGFFDANEIPEDPREPEPVNPPSGSKLCGTCSGRKSCWDCGGKGEHKKLIPGMIGQYSTKTCTTCYGLKKCPTCKGHGWVN